MNPLKSSLSVSQRLFQFFSPVLKKNVRLCSNKPPSVNLEFNENGIAIVTLQKPPLNVMTLSLLNDLIKVINEVKAKGSRGMILTSNQPKIFTAGLDLKVLFNPAQEKVETYWTTLQEMWLTLYKAPFITVAVITGHSPGGGCLLACSCDYRIMVSGKSRIGFNETQLGLGIPPWFVDVYKSILPERVADKALISGYMFSDTEALQVQLIDEVAENNDDGMERAIKFLDSLKKNGLEAMAVTKNRIRRRTIALLENNRKDDLIEFLDFLKSKETQQRLAMMLESLKKK